MTLSETLRTAAGVVGVTPGEMLGAIAGVLGGVIGAAGAAIAVYRTLAGQRTEDRQRIHDALVREMIEFARIAVGHLTHLIHRIAGIR